MNQFKLRIHKKQVEKRLDDINEFIDEAITWTPEQYHVGFEDDFEYLIERKNIQLSTVRGRLETLRDDLDTLTEFVNREFRSLNEMIEYSINEEAHPGPRPSLKDLFRPS